MQSEPQPRRWAGLGCLLRVVAVEAAEFSLLNPNQVFACGKGFPLGAGCDRY